MNTPLPLLWLLLWLSPLLQAEPTPAPKPAEGDPKYAAVSRELRGILVTDQKGREELEELAKKHGYSSPEIQALWKKIEATDATNLIRVKAIVAEHGWLGAKEVGAEANNALFLVIQHSDPATQREYLPLMRAAAKAGKADARALALLEDRVAIGEGRPQTYGSQLRQEGDGPLYVQAMEDPDHVDERRAAIGLKPMADYLKNWNLTWDLAAYKKQLPDLLARLHPLDQPPTGK